MRLLVRTWNVFHGNTSPPQRRAFLQEMIGLAGRDRPDVLCLQELPVWSLSYLEDWSRMTVVADVTRRAPLGIGVGRLITSLDHGLFRSVLTGQANAVLLSREVQVRERASIRLDLGGEPRRCQVVRVASRERSVTVANTHLDSGDASDRELLQAAAFALEFAEPREPVVLAGDFNITSERSHALRTLAGADSLVGATATGIDHVLARGLHGAAGEPWPLERRTIDGRVLSDHPPVDRKLM